MALLLALALIAAACGGSDDAGDSGDGKTTDTGSASDVDPNGVLRLGQQMTFPNGTHLDPTESAVNPDRQWMELVFGTLLRRNAEGGIDPWMASDFEIVDPQTVTLTVRDGATFSDGTPYDAAAVKAGLERTLTQSSEATVPSLSVAFKDISEITTAGNVVTIKLKTPQAGELVAALADREGVIVSPTQAASAPDQIDVKPIGAGPYTVEEFVTGQKVSLKKNPGFWDSDSWQLGGIEYVAVGDGAGLVNGLLSDTLDMSTGLPSTESARLEGAPGIELARLANDRSYVFLNLCSGKAPFDDENVRKALQVGIDRENVDTLIYGGNATPALGFWPENNAYYNPAVADIVSTDEEKAKELLGGKTVDVDFYLAPGPEYQRIAEVLQAQLKDVGFNVKFTTPTDLVSEVITPQKPGALLIPGSRTGVDKYNRVFAPGQIQALCGVSRPEIVDPLAAAAGLVPGAPEAASLFHDAELKIAEGAFIIPIVYSPLINAYSTQRVGGAGEYYAATSQPMLDTFYIKS